MTTHRPKFGDQHDIWRELRRLGTGTVREIADAAKARPDTTRDYLLRLAAAGIVEEDGLTDAPDHLRQKIWRLMTDLGAETPRVTRAGVRVVMGEGRRNMWRAARILGRFSAEELQAASASSRVAPKLNDVRSYLTALRRGGYVVCLSRNVRGGGCFMFVAASFTGPQPPMVRGDKTVIDANTGEVRWTPPARETVDAR